MNITLEPVKIEQKQILKNLGELYAYECTKESEQDINDLGHYDDFIVFDSYWTNKDHHPFFIRVNGRLAGFVLVNKYRQIKEIESDYTIDDYFVLQKYKRLGVENYFSKQLFDWYKGKWQIALDPLNEMAMNDWIKAVDKYTGGAFKAVDNGITHSEGVTGFSLVFDA